MPAVGMLVARAKISGLPIRIVWGVHFLVMSRCEEAAGAECLPDLFEEFHQNSDKEAAKNDKQDKNS